MNEVKCKTCNDETMLNDGIYQSYPCPDCNKQPERFHAESENYDESEEFIQDEISKEAEDLLNEITKDLEGVLKDNE